MDVEINNVIYMELNSGPKIANSTCGKTIDVETIDRDSTVFCKWELVSAECVDAFYFVFLKILIFFPEVHKGEFKVKVYNLHKGKIL
jgi:hypothetical protein